jgi:hypothetical protein
MKETDQETLQATGEMRETRLSRRANENNLLVILIAPAPNDGSANQQCCAE